MSSETIQLLLADDDKDDCLFFEEALTEISISTHLTTVQDGEQLMALLLNKSRNLPHALFLDLNMPLKNGFECLEEIKLNEDLKHLFVIVFSTSSEQAIVNLLYESRAQHYVRKPAEFSQLKKIIDQALKLIRDSLLVGQESSPLLGAKDSGPPQKENFVLTGD